MMEAIKIKYTTEMTVRDASGRLKMLWQENILGRTLRLFGFDIQRKPLGRLVPVLRTSNTITNVGHAAANGRVSNQGGYSPFVNLAIGIGTQVTPATATALNSEITTNGGARGLATASQVQQSVTNDTMQLIKQWTFSGSFAITEEGIFDSASPGGTMLAYQTFSVVNVVTTDQFTITHKVTS